jgi:mono/diheme cytochrome c family protein
MAAAMWSHATGMWEAMRAAGIERPALTAQGAADMYAYLTGDPSREEPGDVARGRAVFEAKLCVACHEPGTYASVELPRPDEGHSAFTLIASLWEHGNGMLARMVATDRRWQSLSAQETRDLLAYLNSWE